MSPRALTRIVGLAAALLLIPACSSDKEVTGASTTVAGSTASTEPATTVPGDTVAPSTEAPTTVAPTTAPPAPAGWTIIDPSTIDAPLAFPCCASNWYGASPSPALPDAGTMLADGAYRIDFDWPADPTQPITATVYRFEQCSLLPEGSCEDIGGPYPPEEIGVDASTSYELTFSLDSSLVVNLGGFTGDDQSFATGTGADLAELITALDADYQAAILDPIAAGASADDVIAGLIASPAYGFEPPAQEFSGTIAYRHAGSPPLLFQGLPGVGEFTEGDRGSDVMGRISLLVVDGQLHLQVYAGFYS